MRKSAKIITALSVTGLAVVAGSAFTGAGLTNAADVEQFIGGTVSQAVDGATLDNISYTVTDAGDASATKTSGATLTFTEAIPSTSELSVKFVGTTTLTAADADCVVVTGTGVVDDTTFTCTLPNGGSVASLASTFVTVKAITNINA